MVRFPHHRTVRSRGRAFRTAVLAAAGSLLVAACAGSSSDTDATDSSPSTTDTPAITQPVERDENEVGEPAESSVPSPATSEPDPGESTTGDETAAGDERVGYELLERMDDGTLRAWVSADPMTLEEFDAIELAPGWIKNQPRESSVDGGAFDASPGADELVYEEHFGFRWFHSATVVEVGVPVDDEGLLTGSLVEKAHEISYEPGSTVIALVSPDGETYVRIGRDAGRATDDPTLPTGWEIVEIDVPDGYTTMLPVPTLVIRTDNEDSFQGPVSGW